MSTPPAYPPTPAGGPPIPPGSAEVGVIGKHRNPLLAWLVWPLITLGIYHLVSWYKINREVGLRPAHRGHSWRRRSCPLSRSHHPGSGHTSQCGTHRRSHPAGTSRCGDGTNGSMQSVDRTAPGLRSRTALALLPDVAEQPLGVVRHATGRQPGSAACLGRPRPGGSASEPGPRPIGKHHWLMIKLVCKASKTAAKI